MRQWILLSVWAGCTANVEITKVEIDEPTGDEAREVVASGGDRIQFHDLEVAVPYEVGEGVGLAAETDDGLIQIDVENRGDGVAAVRVVASEPVSTTEPAQTADLTSAACSDPAFVRTGHRWPTSYAWYLSNSYNPTAAAESMIVRGADNIVTQRNDCGLVDEVSATHTYRGRTSIATQSGSGSCPARDGRNIVGMGPSSSYKAYACWYWDATGYLIEADIRFKSDQTWITTTSVPAGCTNALHLESVATHEFGHVFGLGHPGTNHPTQTMQPGAACDNSKATLGLGDVTGLRWLY